MGCLPCGRRDSSSQITTLETDLDAFCPNMPAVAAGTNAAAAAAAGGGGGSGGGSGGAGSGHNPKRRRSSLAQLTDILREFSGVSGGSKEKEKSKEKPHPPHSSASGYDETLKFYRLPFVSLG